MEFNVQMNIARTQFTTYDDDKDSDQTLEDV